MTSPVVRVDPRRWHARTVRAERVLVRVTDQVLAQWAAQVVDSIRLNAPADTRRFVRGWVLAGEAVGAAVLPPPEPRPSRYRPVYRAVLVRQAERLASRAAALERRVEVWFQRPGRPLAGWAAEARAAALKLRALEAQARRELAVFDTSPLATVIGAGRGALGRFASGADADAAADAGPAGPVVRVRVNAAGRLSASGRLVTTVRPRVYGGTGSLITLPSGVRAVVLHNLEAHASIVEARTRVFRAALARLRAFGAAAVTRRALSVVANQSG